MLRFEWNRKLTLFLIHFLFLSCSVCCCSADELELQSLDVRYGPVHAVRVLRVMRVTMKAISLME